MKAPQGHAMKKAKLTEEPIAFALRRAVAGPFNTTTTGQAIASVSKKPGGHPPGFCHGAV